MKTMKISVYLLSVVFLHSVAYAYPKPEILPASPKAAFQKVGEVQVAAKPCMVKKILTLGFAGHSPEGITKRLDKKLRKAGKLSRADAIIDVKYYPSVTEPSYFKTKEFYARGTLIKYNKFPAEAPKPAAPAAA